jgi:hypothetical protein
MTDFKAAAYTPVLGGGVELTLEKCELITMDVGVRGQRIVISLTRKKAREIRDAFDYILSSERLEG